jgi:hypothetical protein
MGVADRTYLSPRLSCDLLRTRRTSADRVCQLCGRRVHRSHRSLRWRAAARTVRTPVRRRRCMTRNQRSGDHAWCRSNGIVTPSSRRPCLPLCSIRHPAPSRACSTKGLVCHSMTSSMRCALKRWQRTSANLAGLTCFARRSTRGSRAKSRSILHSKDTPAPLQRTRAAPIRRVTRLNFRQSPVWRGGRRQSSGVRPC